MGYLKVAKGAFKAMTGPLSILEEWASEKIRSGIAKDEATHKVNLEIRMQTEINRINAETEEWQKDQQVERGKKILEAIKKYQKELMELNTNGIKAIGEMDIELRRKAQDLVLEKTKQYKLLQEESQKEAEEEMDRIIEKYSNNERVMNIMLTASESKLTNIIESCSRFIQELNEDIHKMNENINQLTQKGQVFILEQLNKIGPSNPSLLAGTIEEAKIIEDK